MDANITIHRSIDAGRESWLRCEEHADSVHYGVQRLDWLAHWQASVGRSLGVEPCLVEISDEQGRPLLFCPLAIQPRGSLRILTWLGGDITDYQAPIVCAAWRDRPAGELGRLWARIEAQLPAHDVAHFERQPERIGDLDNPVLELSRQAPHEVNHSCRVESDWETLGPQLIGSRACADLRRKRRRLGEMGSLEFRVADTPASARRITECMIDQKIERYLATRTYNLFKTDAYRSFFLDPPAKLIESGFLHVSALVLDDRMLATHWGIVAGGRFYYIMASFDAAEAWSRHSTGRLLIEDLFRWCWSNGVGVLDFTVGDEPWKRKWSNQGQRLFQRVAPGSLRGRSYAVFVALADAIRRRPALHRLVSGLRNLRG